MPATAYEGLNSILTVRRVDPAGDSQEIQVDKLTIMRRYNLPARDLVVLDSPGVYPSTILVRARAIVVNLENIFCIIAADEALLLDCISGVECAEELQRRLRGESESSQGRGLRSSSDVMIGNNNMSSAYYLPFEFRALEVALQFVCNYLASQLNAHVAPLLDDLTSNVSTRNLGRVRESKSDLFELTQRVQQVRDEIKRLMDDDKAMAEMYLTDKIRRRLESSVSVPSSTPDSTRLDDKSPSKEMSRHESMRGNESNTDGIEDLALLLGACLVVFDNALKVLIALKEVIDATEDFINIHLDTVRNELIKFDLLMTTATFVLAIFGVVFGIFGTNLKISLYDSRGAFKWVLIITCVCGAVVSCSFVCYFKYKRLMPH